MGRISLRLKKQVENAGAKTRMQHQLRWNPWHPGSGWEARLRFNLLCEQVAAEGHSTIEGDRGEVSAPATLALGPGANCRRDAVGHRLQSVEHAEVNADGANLASIFGPVRAEAEQLDNAVEVLS